MWLQSLHCVIPREPDQDEAFMQQRQVRHLPRIPVHAQKERVSIVRPHIYHSIRTHQCFLYIPSTASPTAKPWCNRGEAGECAIKVNFETMVGIRFKIKANLSHQGLVPM